MKLLVTLSQPMTNVGRWTLLLVTLAIVPLASVHAQKPQADKPNVLFIAVDDLRPELGCYGVKEIQTPHIDQLSREAVTFTRAYCQQAVCNPSRASLMTGLRPDSIKVWDLRTDFRKTSPKVVTIPQHFREHGYFATAIGKIYHNNLPDPISWSEEKHYIKGFPFDPDAVYLTKPNLEWLEQRKKQLIAKRDKRRIDRFGLWYLKATATEAPVCADSDYYDGAQTDVAIKKLAELKKRKEPFFYAVGYYRPHLPFNAPKRYWDLYDPAKIPLAVNRQRAKGAPLMAINTMRELRGSYNNFTKAPRPDQGSLSEKEARHLKHGYYASVSYIDAQIGRLLAELKRLDLWDNTIVVLWGDHGWKLGEHNSWCKMTNYEIDTRVPLIMRVPGAKENGRQCDRLVEFVDIYPSLCEAAGLPLRKELEGRSFVPLLANRRLQWKRAAFSQFLREGIWTAPDGIVYMGRSVRTDRYRYVRWVRQSDKQFVAEELYDHAVDSRETRNLAGKPEMRALVFRLRRELD